MPNLKTPAIEGLIQDIWKAREDDLKGQIRPQSKRNYMYLSDIHSCVRHNYYSMAEGDKRKPFETYVIALMNSGNVWERETVRELMKYGFEVVLAQQTIVIPYAGRIKKLQGKTAARGKIDGMILYKRDQIPFEIKSMGQNVYARIETVEDLFSNEWTEKYVRQLLMYLYGNNKEYGFFLLNDRSGHWKMIPVYLGNWLDYAEKTLRLIEDAWEAKALDKIPDRIPYNHKICGRCNFNTICCPETVIEGGAVLDDPELEARLARHSELKPMHKEYGDLHEDLRALFKDKPQTTIGHFIVQPKLTEKKATIKVKSLPAALQKRHKKLMDAFDKYRGPKTQSWSFTIDDINVKPKNAQPEG